MRSASDSNYTELDSTIRNEISYTIYRRSVFKQSGGSYCTGGPKKDAKPNMYPITEPTLVHVADYYSKNDDVGGGRLFNAIHHLGNSTFPVLHLYGTGYDMGFAQGMLLKDRLLKMWDMFFDYVVKNTPGGMPNVEKPLNPIAKSSKKFIPTHFTDELKGLSDATGYNYTKLLWIHLFPESAVGHCSMFGAWGKATSKSYAGKLLQMRALDYITADFFVGQSCIDSVPPKRWRSIY